MPTSESSSVSGDARYGIVEARRQQYQSLG